MPETAEQIGGFYLIDVTDERAAQEAAQCLPRQYTLEVRPAIEIDGYERSDPPGVALVRVAASPGRRLIGVPPKYRSGAEDFVG